MAARPRRRGAGTHRAGTWHRGPTERAPRGPSHQTAVPRHGTAAAGGGFDSSGKPGAESCPFAPLSSPVRASIVPFGLRGVLEDSSRAGLPAAGATPSIPGIEAQGHVVRKDGHAGFSPGPVGAGRYRGRRGHRRLAAGRRPRGYPANRLRLLSGAAWLVSTQVGQVTLLDGSTAEVAAQVPVAPPGTRLDVVQQGANAYAVNRTAGSVRRVDGGTFTVSQPAIPLPNAGDGLQALAAPGVLYALDTSRGVLTSADPLTLATRTAPVPLATPVTGESAVLDEAGRLWVLDGASGSLVWIDHGPRPADRLRAGHAHVCHGRPARRRPGRRGGERPAGVRPGLRRRPGLGGRPGPGPRRGRAAGARPAHPVPAGEPGRGGVLQRPGQRARRGDPVRRRGPAGGQVRPEAAH